MAVIGIDKGHTLQNGGCCGACGLLKESVENRPVGDLVIQGLRLKGHTVVDCSCDYATNASDQLYNIVKKANAQPLDLFISLHLNAFNGSGYGAEIITTTTTSQENKEHADKVINHYCDKLGFKNRGHKYNNDLYVLRKTNAKAMLIEMCFVDNQGDANRWNQLGHQAIANAIIEGVLYEVGESEIIEEPSKEETNPQNNLVSIETSKKVLGDRCKDIQLKLMYLGYNLGKYGANGIFGECTYNAIIQFQKDHSDVLEVDGSCGNATASLINELYNAKVQANSRRELKLLEKVKYKQVVYGKSGSHVYLLQSILTELGYNVSGIDGHCGNGLTNAIKAYQRNNGLSVDGSCYVEMWTHILTK